MASPHIMFRDEACKLHATPAAALAADLGDLLGSEVFARRAMECRVQLRAAFDALDELEATYGDVLADQPATRAKLSFTAQHPAANQGEANAHLPN